MIQFSACTTRVDASSKLRSNFFGGYTSIDVYRIRICPPTLRPRSAEHYRRFNPRRGSDKENNDGRRRSIRRPRNRFCSDGRNSRGTASAFAVTPAPARRPRRGAAGRARHAEPVVRARGADGEGQHDRPRRDRYDRDGRPAAFRDRHDGDFRNRFDPGRTPRHRADQRNGRRARPQDPDHSGRRRIRLADLRREVEEAARKRSRRGGVRLLDLGVAQSGAAGVRKG